MRHFTTHIFAQREYPVLLRIGERRHGHDEEDEGVEGVDLHEVLLLVVQQQHGEQVEAVGAEIAELGSAQVAASRGQALFGILKE